MGQSTTNDFLLSTHDLAQLVGKDSSKVLEEIESKFGPLPYKSHIEPAIVRRYLSSKGYKYKQKTISFQMLKGGVAKTTSSVNFGIRAAMYGFKVLFVDLDQQANLTFSFGVDAEEKPVWIDIFEKKSKITDVIIEVDSNIHLIPSSLNNSVLDRSMLNSNRNWSGSVANYLKEVKEQYDLIIIDTAPSLSAVNTAVTCASDMIVLPINPDKFSMIGLKKHLEDLAELEDEFSVKPDKKVLFTRFDARESSSHDILAQCTELFNDILVKQYVRTSSDIKNAIGARKTIFANKSNAKEDYDSVTREILGFE